jgi:ubiquitin-protein ligase
MRNPDQSFIVHQSEENILHVHALVFGPSSTPYSHGMFDFTLGWWPEDGASTLFT